MRAALQNTLTDCHQPLTSSAINRPPHDAAMVRAASW